MVSLVVHTKPVFWGEMNQETSKEAHEVSRVTFGNPGWPRGACPPIPQGRSLRARVYVGISNATFRHKGVSWYR